MKRCRRCCIGVSTRTMKLLSREVGGGQQWQRRVHRGADGQAMGRVGRARGFCRVGELGSCSIRRSAAAPGLCTSLEQQRASRDGGFPGSGANPSLHGREPSAQQAEQARHGHMVELRGESGRQQIDSTSSRMQHAALGHLVRRTNVEGIDSKPIHIWARDGQAIVAQREFRVGVNRACWGASLFAGRRAPR